MSTLPSGSGWQPAWAIPRGKSGSYLDPSVEGYHETHIRILKMPIVNAVLGELEAMDYTFTKRIPYHGRTDEKQREA